MKTNNRAYFTSIFCNFSTRRFVLGIKLLVYLLIIQNSLMIGTVFAAEKYERKSILFMNKILSTPSASNIPKDKASELMMVVKKQIEMPRFDYNPLPDSLQAPFWEKEQQSFIENKKNIDSLKVEINRIEQMRHDLLEHQIFPPEYNKPGKSISDIDIDMLDRERHLKDNRRVEAERLFQQIASLLTETLSPSLIKILGDPKLLELRAKEDVDEVELNKFISTKAKDFGITSDDLEKVMNSAYLYLIVLTDYSQSDEGVVELAGSVIWFKFVYSENGSFMQVLKTVEAKGLSIPEFAINVNLETRKVDDFSLKAGITEVNGNNIGFALGNREGIYIDQKFAIYENIATIRTKQGFFYVYKVDDNNSNKAELSYGKLVKGIAEPGMQILEIPVSKLTMKFGFRSGTLTIEKFDQLRSLFDWSRDINKINANINTICIAADYDIGNNTKIPQLFLSFGMEFSDITPFYSLIKIKSKKPSKLTNISYSGFHTGLLKKHYIGRVALYIQPLFRFHELKVGSPIYGGNKAYSFSPNFGFEFILNEKINMGIALNIELPSLRTDNWRKGEIKPFYSKSSFSVYINNNMGKEHGCLSTSTIFPLVYGWYALQKMFDL